jgi:hypothetical protein
VSSTLGSSLKVLPGAAAAWLQISKTASQKMTVDLAGLAATAAAAIGVHILFLVVNTAACR